MAEPKTQPTDVDVDAFVAAIEHPTRRADCATVVQMMREITGEPPVVWGTSLIGFGTYHYQYASGREGDWPISAVAARKASLVVYIMAGFGDYDALMAKLGKHKTGSSCLYINKLADVDLAVLRELIQGSVTAMREKYPA